ncbi:aldo/keto reductase [Pleomorphochaeta sp. DL1XJH-081]|uniref:aldo/keto reductase n=1 Tax=Pleomorphochaeta sp. DL1XJH-081 TaxID=3409690 RepID=UPI003BB52253
MQTPYITIPQTKAKIPAIGLGTFGSDHVEPDAIAKAVRMAVEMGYRHIDCASVYGNEKQIGEVLSQLFADGVVKREDLWITGKLWNDKHDPIDARASFEQSLKDLQLDYLDLYLIHWPFPNYHPPKCSIDSRSPNAIPYDHDRYMATWRVLESLVDEGLTRHIGSSNMTIPKMELLLRDARIKPACNEMELHPHFQQPDLVAFCKENGIVPIGYSPLGSPGRPERDRTHDDSVDMEDPVIVKIAKDHSVHPATICLKWAAANGHVPIPFSTKERNIRSNMEAVSTDPLSSEEKQAIDGIDRNCRLIKGHVFLWEGANDWHDLWDEDGTITK